MSQLLTFLTAVLLVAAARSHSWIAVPNASNRNHFTNCLGSECNLFCPQLTNRANSTVDDPEAIFQRGQRTNIAWMRNNHRGGMARFAFVPANAMYSNEAHNALAFFYTCWDSFEARCGFGFDNCGSDEDGLRFETTVTVPACLPDGDYVLAYVWYGGLVGNRQHGKFADYPSCTFVRIAGGVPLQNTCNAVYANGPNRVNLDADNKCRTAADRPGSQNCPRDNDPRCTASRSFFAYPEPFQSGRAPIFSAATVAQFSGKPLPSGVQTVTTIPSTTLAQDGIPVLPQEDPLLPPDISEAHGAVAVLPGEGTTPPTTEIAPVAPTMPAFEQASPREEAENELADEEEDMEVEGGRCNRRCRRCRTRCNRQCRRRRRSRRCRTRCRSDCDNGHNDNDFDRRDDFDRPDDFNRRDRRDSRDRRDRRARRDRRDRRDRRTDSFVTRCRRNYYGRRSCRRVRVGVYDGFY